MKFWVCIEERTDNKIYKGKAYLVDWPKKQILKTWCPPVHFPRTGNGIRAFQWFDDEQCYYVLDRQIVWKLNKDLFVIERLMPYKYFMGHHVVKYQGQLVYTSVMYDGIFFDHKRTGLKRRIDINSVYTDGDGLYLFSRSTGRFFQYKPEFKVILDDVDLVACHDLQFFYLDGKKYIYVNQREGQVTLIDTEDYKHRIHYKVDVKGERTLCSIPGVMKGMLRVGTHSIIVGSAPAQLFQINLRTGETEDEWFIAETDGETVHGLNFDRQI